MEPAKAKTFTNQQLQIMDVIENVDLSERDLRGIDFSGKTLKQVFFDRANLTEANFRDATLESVSFGGAICVSSDFSNSKISKMRGVESDFRKAKFINSQIFDSELEHPILSKADFTGAKIKDSALKSVSALSAEENFALESKSEDEIEKLTLLEACFDEAEISNSFLDGIFYGTSLRNVSFNSVTFDGSLRECDFSQSYFLAAQSGLCPFNNSRFDRVEIENSKFEGAEFGFCSFKDAKLKGSSFEGALFLGTSMEPLELFNCIFTGAEYNSAQYENYPPTKFPANISIKQDMIDRSGIETTSLNNLFVQKPEFIQARRARFESLKPISSLSDAFLVLGIDLLNVLPSKGEEDEDLNDQVYLIETSLIDSIYSEKSTLEKLLEDSIGLTDKLTIHTVLVTFDSLDDFETKNEREEVVALLYKLMKIVSKDDYYENCFELGYEYASKRITGLEFKEKFCKIWIDSNVRLAASNFAVSIQRIKEDFGDALVFAKSEYRRIARASHPDVAKQSDISKFHLASEAMRLLTNLGFYSSIDEPIVPKQALKLSDLNAPKELPRSVITEENSSL